MFFYSWGEPVYALIMLFSIAANYVFGLLIACSGKAATKKRFLFFGIAANLAALFYFKYTHFLLVNIDPSGYLETLVPLVALPIGISFYTFQAMSYIIDIYRGRVAAQRNPIYLGMYIAFFPQLIAGPIVTYNVIEDQILYRKTTWHKFSIGFCRFVTGLGKKVLIANNMAIVADRIYEMAAFGSLPASLSWLGAASYTLQIYFDFSAYSDMAIGLGLLFGFVLPENFDYPYCAKSVTEFWRRWHMTLGQWFRDYVYFPLGGSRVGNLDLLVRNLFVVWLLTGLWHGAEWTFVMWGILQFVCMVGEKLFSFEKMRLSRAKHLYLILVIIISFALFRSDNLPAASVYYAGMFGFAGFWSDFTWMFVKENLVVYLAAILFCLPVSRRFNYMLVNGNYGWAGKLAMGTYPALILGIFLLSLTYLVKGAYNPFIYFRF
ncbi:MAG: hypothetical protein LBO03_02255 [Acidaminococcales bacterium]|nr:hypothetical protein [Acidaminococcales bacterium]